MKPKNNAAPLLLSITALLFLNPSHIQAQAYAHAGEYMNQMGQQYRAITKDMWDYTNAIARGKRAKKIEGKRQDLLNTMKSTKSFIQRMPDYEGDAALRDSAVSYIELSYLVISEDYAKIVDMEEIAEQSYDLMEAYMMAQEAASDKLKEAHKRLHEEEKRFADDHGITLIEDQSKLAKKLEKADEVFDYYSVIYLIFFKSYKQDAYLTDAVNKADVSAIEQNKNALAQTAEEGLGLLKKQHPYEGDASLIQACRDMLTFYQQQAKDASIITDFYLKKENFEKVKEAFEAKKKSQRTQADVDQYNQAINDYNQAVNDYNALNERLNKERSQLLENWNKTTEKFLGKHAV